MGFWLKQLKNGAALSQDGKDFDEQVGGSDLDLLRWRFL
jgi:hypothetical protein